MAMKPSGKSRLRLYVKRHPRLYPLLKRVKGHDLSYHLCTHNAQLCVEGYPCSANTFLYVLLKQLSPTINIAHHTHSTANVRRAVMLNVPAVVMIRHPEAAISSRIVRFGADMHAAVNEYIDFYTDISTVRDRINLIEFSDVVNDCEAVIGRIREQTGVPMEVAGSFETVVKEVKEQIRIWSDTFGTPERVSLPTAERNLAKKELASKLAQVETYQRAVELYHQLSPTDQ